MLNIVLVSLSIPVCFIDDQCALHSLYSWVPSKVTLIEPFKLEADAVFTEGDYLRFLFSPQIDPCELWADINDGDSLALSCSLQHRELSEIDRGLSVLSLLSTLSLVFFPCCGPCAHVCHIAKLPASPVVSRWSAWWCSSFSQPDSLLWSLSLFLCTSLAALSVYHAVCIHVSQQ